MSDKKPKAANVVTDEHRRKSGKRMTDDQWETAKKMWQVEGRTLKEISSHLGITETSLHERFKRHGIRKNEYSEIRKEAVREERIRQAQDGAKELVADAYELRTLAIRGQALVTKHTIRIISDAGKAGNGFATTYPNLKALREASHILKASRELSDDLVLNYEENDSSALPELVVRAMTRDDVEKLQREHEEEAAFMADEGGSIDVTSEDFEVSDV